MTPSISSNKVVLINNAHTMNEVSQNALLKSLEEPAVNSLLFLSQIDLIHYFKPYIADARLLICHL